jgi:hypothetical protein
VKDSNENPGQPLALSKALGGKTAPSPPATPPRTHTWWVSGSRFEPEGLVCRLCAVGDEGRSYCRFRPEELKGPKRKCEVWAEGTRGGDLVSVLRGLVSRCPSLEPCSV